MKMNESSADRIVRVILGIVVGAGAFGFGISTVTGIILAVVAVILLLTGITGFCALYALFHVSTRHDTGGRHHAATA